MPTLRPAVTTNGHAGVLVLARREHRDVVPAVDQFLRTVENVSLHAARHVDGVRADQADPHGDAAASAAGARSGRGGRSAGHSGWTMCQSAGCSGDPRSEEVGHLLCSVGDLVAQPGPVQRHRCRDLARPTAVEVVEMGRAQVGAGDGGQHGRAGRHPGLLAEEVDGDTAGGQVPVGYQADDLAVAQPLPQHRRRVGTPGERQDLEAEALPVGDELVEQRCRLQPLGDGADPAEGACHGEPGDVPVAGVRQRHHDPAAGVHRGAHMLDAGQIGQHRGDHGVVVHRRQPERLLPVPGVGTQRRLGDGREAGRRGGIAEYPLQVAGQLHGARSPPAERGVRRGGERAIGDGQWDRLDHGPADAVTGGDQPLGDPGQPAGAGRLRGTVTR